jgi:hypothetical protein
MNSYSNFDLNIGNYSKDELEELLELPTNYDENVIQMKESKLRQNIMSDLSIPSIIKTKTLGFISNIKNILVLNMQKNNSTNNASAGSKIQNLAKSYNNVYNLNKSLTRSDLVDSGGTYIIKQPPTPYGQSSPSEFYQGTINPLNKRILRQNINIDTRFRDNYYTSQSSNFHLDLPIKLSQVVSLQLSALEMPSTFYAISKVFGNNFFVISLPNASPPVNPLIVTIPDGNYTYLTLQDYINNFIATDPSVPIASDYTKIQFLADINTPGGTGSGGSGKMVVGSTTGDIIFSLNFQTDRYGNEDRQTPLPLKFGWLMGFREGYYENNVTYVSEGLIDLLGPRYIYLAVDDYNNNVSDGFYGAFTASILNKNILARITLQGSVFNIVSQNNLLLVTTSRQYFGPVDIQKMQIQLLDEYGRVLDLNNMDYSFCLSFQTIYDL